MYIHVSFSSFPYVAFCITTAKKLRAKYDELSILLYPNISGKLYAKEVISAQEKQEIDHLIGTKQMQRVLDNVIVSLNSFNTVKYKGLLEAMEESEDILLKNKADELGKSQSISVTYVGT